MVNIRLKYYLVETPRKFIIAKLSIHKARSSSEDRIEEHPKVSKIAKFGREML